MPHLWKTIATATLLILTTQGCASMPAMQVARITHDTDSQTIPPGTHAAQPSPEIATPAPSSAGIERDWSSRTRSGREAIVALDYSAAESLLFDALKAANGFRSSDVRIDVSLGHLMRLAAIYEDLDRPNDSQRILQEIELVTDPQHITRGRIENHHARIFETRTATIRPYDRKDVRARKQRVRSRASAPFDALIRRAAISYNVDPALIKAVVAAESNFEP